MGTDRKRVSGGAGGEATGREEKPAAKEARHGDEWAVVERFAEEAASHTLVPEPALVQVICKFGLPRRDWDTKDIRKLAGLFRITPLAMATRLRVSGYLSTSKS